MGGEKVIFVSPEEVRLPICLVLVFSLLPPDCTGETRRCLRLPGAQETGLFSEGQKPLSHRRGGVYSSSHYMSERANVYSGNELLSFASHAWKLWAIPTTGNLRSQ